MEWRAHRSVCRNTLGGYRKVQRGERLEGKNGVLFYQGSPVCFELSQVAKTHFSPNWDGMGLERGDITWRIAFGITLSKKQKEILTSDAKCRIYLVPDERVILFNDLFFQASIPELHKICSKLEIKR